MEFKEPLPEEEQKLLFEKLKETNDSSIKEKLILHNLKLVNWVSLKYYKPGKNELDDLFQQGVIGLIKAMDRYNPNKGTFANYATWWIRQAITRGIEGDKIIKIPSYMALEVNRLIKIRNSLIQDLGREPTINEISMAMDLDIEEVLKVVSIIQDPISLNTIIGGEDEDLTLEDTIPDEAPGPETIISDKVFIEQIKAEIKPKLTELQYNSIILYYGLNGREHTLQEIANKYGYSREYIRSQNVKALRIMRGTTFFLELWKDIEERTTYYKSIDYSQPSVNGGQIHSSVEDIVLKREKLKEVVLQQYLKSKRRADKILNEL